MWEFEIVTVEKAKPPMGNGKGRWYRYTIANRITEITGTRCGSRDEVVNFVRSSVQRLNNRHKALSFSKA
ncbi:MAG: hypothetical protein ACQETD_12495 [Pseudomonadota bacterium]